jgi:hypothetical protein
VRRSRAGLQDMRKPVGIPWVQPALVKQNWQKHCRILV